MKGPQNNGIYIISLIVVIPIEYYSTSIIVINIYIFTFKHVYTRDEEENIMLGHSAHSYTRDETKSSKENGACVFVCMHTYMRVLLVFYHHVHLDLK